MTTLAQHAPRIEDGGPTVVSSGFLGLLVAQFLGALNDNISRWLIAFIGIAMYPDQKALILAGAGACFVIPYLLLAAPAGYLADRFSKQKVIVGCKVAEIVLMTLAVFAIWCGSLSFMFVVIFLMGSQSALFSPSKYGSIPELVRARSVSAANGLIGMSTILGIVLGMIAGGALYQLTRPYGLDYLWVSGVVLIGVATVGTIASLFVTHLEAADPRKPFPYNIAAHTFSDLWFLAKHRSLVSVATVNAIFWGMGALFQVAITPYGTDILGVNEATTMVMAGTVMVGVGIGSVFSGVWSAGRTELGIVPFGIIIMGICAALMFFITPVAPVGAESTVFYWTLVVLVGLGFGGGLYVVPLESFLQRESDEDSRGRIIAGGNFLSFASMLIAYGIFYVLSEPCNLSTSTIFLLSGLAMLPVALVTLVCVPAATIRAFVWLVSRLMYRVKIKGLEHVPEKGGALFVCNHVSFIDGVLLILAFPRQIRMFAYDTFVDQWWNRWIAREMGTIKVSSSRKSVVRAIREAREGLANGDLVCVFPEGGITRTGRMNEFQPGFVSVHGDTGVPVIPIRLDGLWGSIFSFERGRFFWKWPKRLFRYRVNIIIGEPIEDPTDVQAVRQAVEALAPPEVPDPEEAIPAKT